MQNDVVPNALASNLTQRCQNSKYILKKLAPFLNFAAIYMQLLILPMRKAATVHIQGGPKKRGHSTFSQISRKILKISK